MKEETLKGYRREIKIKNSHSSLIGSSLLIVATLLPCLDRFISWFWPSVDVLTDNRGVVYSVNIWIASIYLSAVFLILAAFFRPNKKIYYFPLTMFAYSSIVYYSPIFGYNIKFLQWNSWLAGLIAVVSMLPIMKMLKQVKYLTLAERADDEFYDEFADEVEKLNRENENLKTKLKSLKN